MAQNSLSAMLERKQLNSQFCSVEYSHMVWIAIKALFSSSISGSILFPSPGAGEGNNGRFILKLELTSRAS